jgi:hypothetical protein
LYRNIIGKAPKAKLQKKYNSDDESEKGRYNPIINISKFSERGDEESNVKDMPKSTFEEKKVAETQVNLGNRDNKLQKGKFKIGIITVYHFNSIFS